MKSILSVLPGAYRHLMIKYQAEYLCYLIFGLFLVFLSLSQDFLMTSIVVALWFVFIPVFFCNCDLMKQKLSDGQRKIKSDVVKEIAKAAGG